MPYGLVPYRDLYEHKGPLLYTLHALASLVSYDSFLGIYFIEIISCYAFLVYLFKSLNIFYERKYILILIPIFCSLIYSSAPFSCGDSAEEFCLPLLAYTFYIGLKCIKNFSLPTNKESFIIGITSGSVLWIKYTMLGLHIGWMIVPIYLAIKSKSIRNFITMLLYIVLGVTVATIPFILYFGINNAIYDWFNIYFYTNIFTYGSTSSSSLIDSLIQTWFGIYSIWIKSGIELFLISFGLIWAAFKKNKLYLYYALSLSVFMMIFTYGGGKRYIYYAFTLWILAILGMCACVEVLICLISNIDCKFNSKTGLCLFSSVIISIVLVLICNQNIKLVTYSQADLPQYKVNSDILESGVENPSLLNFGFLDGGFYTTTGIIPNCRHFCYLNIPLEEMKEEQMSYVYNGITDFVITQNFEISTDKYRLLNSYDDPYSGHNYTYYLYQKTS